MVRKHANSRILKSFLVLIIVLFVLWLIQKNGIRFSTEFDTYKFGNTTKLVLQNYTFWPFRYIDRCYNPQIKAYKQIPGGWQGVDINVLNCSTIETRKWLWPLTKREFNIVIDQQFGSGEYKFDMPIDVSWFLDRRYSILDSEIYNEQIINSPLINVIY